MLDVRWLPREHASGIVSGYLEKWVLFSKKSLKYFIGGAVVSLLEYMILHYAVIVI